MRTGALDLKLGSREELERMQGPGQGTVDDSVHAGADKRCGSTKGGAEGYRIGSSTVHDEVALPVEAAERLGHVVTHVEQMTPRSSKHSLDAMDGSGI